MRSRIQGDAKIADSEAEGDSADSPEDAVEQRIPDGAGLGEVDLVDDPEEARDEDAAEHERCDDPCGEPLDEPVDLPRPALDAAEGDKVRSRCKSANAVVHHTEKRICTHQEFDSGKVRCCEARSIERNACWVGKIKSPNEFQGSRDVMPIADTRVNALRVATGIGSDLATRRDGNNKRNCNRTTLHCATE